MTGGRAAALDPDWLDREYNARAAIPEHARIFARWRRDSDAARARLRREEDFYYGSSPAETLDLFPAATSGGPMLIFIHGGYWRSLDKRDFAFLAEPYVHAGAAVAMVNYALCPAVHIEQIVQQMLRACAWLWRNCMGFGVSPERLYVAGHSAGAHLAAMMLSADWPTYGHDLPPGLLRGGVLVSGLYDLAPLVRAPFLAADLRLRDAQAARLSPVRYAPPLARPLVTAVGAAESAEFQRQNGLLATAWPHMPLRDIALPGRHHLSAVEALGEREHPLHRAALELLGVRR